jgi:hypothetical protein
MTLGQKVAPQIQFAQSQMPQNKVELEEGPTNESITTSFPRTISPFL